MAWRSDAAGARRLRRAVNDQGPGAACPAGGGADGPEVVLAGHIWPLLDREDKARLLVTSKDLLRALCSQWVVRARCINVAAGADGLAQAGPGGAGTEAAGAGAVAGAGQRAPGRLLSLLLPGITELTLDSAPLWEGPERLLRWGDPYRCGVPFDYLRVLDQLVVHGGAKSLVSLSLRCLGIVPASGILYNGLRHLGSCVLLPALSELSLVGVPLGSEEASAIAARLHRLRVLRLVNVTDAGADAVVRGLLDGGSKLTALTRLEVKLAGRLRVVDEFGLAPFADLRSLVALSLGNDAVPSDAQLGLLRGLTSLQELRIGGFLAPGVSAAQARLLAPLTGLRCLELKLKAVGGVVDLAWATLLRRLETLAVDACRERESVLARGLAALTALTSLRHLELTDMLWSGDRQLLLGHLTSLRALDLSATTAAQGVDLRGLSLLTSLTLVRAPLQQMVAPWGQLRHLCVCFYSTFADLPDVLGILRQCPELQAAELQSGAADLLPGNADAMPLQLLPEGSLAKLRSFCLTEAAGRPPGTSRQVWLRAVAAVLERASGTLEKLEFFGTMRTAGEGEQLLAAVERCGRLQRVGLGLSRAGGGPELARLGSAVAALRELEVLHVGLQMAEYDAEYAAEVTRSTLAASSAGGRVIDVCIRVRG
jgi:hypothetical protein